MATSEERAIAAARDYIAKHKSMHPSIEVLRSLEEQERRLEERQRVLDEADGRHSMLAGR
ncbi:hypothetical protein [Cellulomonas taurus]|uniref:hypothetical protein n=1 Tax=Cellulomonas taurus TaxID=2729175 RepID=UPI00145C48A6|nr:hypothetical protein [Cellulomonas taurus]